VLKQKFLIDFVSKFGIYFVGAICGIVVARVAGPEVVGTIAYATAYVSVFSFITGIFGSAHIKLISEGQNEANCNSTYSWLLGFSVLIYFSVVLGTFLFQKFSLHYNFDGNSPETVILITLVATVISSVYGYSQTIFVARTEQARSNMPDLARAFIYNGLRILVVLLGYGAVALAGVNLLSVVIILPLVVYFIRKLDFGKFNFKLAKKYSLIAIPLFTIVITNSVITYSDKLILEYYSNAREIGIYTAAFSIGGLLILLGNTAGTVFFPLFSSLLSKNDLTQVRKKISQFERFVFVFVLPLIITLSLFAYPVIVTLLGTKYEQSAPIFGLLVFSSFFIIWGMPYGNVISGLGLFWLGSFINFLKFLVFIGTLFLCIHPSLLNMGAMALAVTQIAINFFLFSSYYILAYRKIKVQFLKEQSRFILFWSVIYFSSIFLLIPFIKSYSVYMQSLIIMPLFLIVVFIIQRMLGFMKKQDLQMFLQLINPQKSYQYVKHEIKDHSHNEPPPGL
jgi:O-antigen/teichoic acid export membrane protein